MKSVVLSFQVRILSRPGSSSICDEQPKTIYVKATWSHAKEATVLAEISKFAPSFIPKVIALDCNRNTLIQKDAGSSTVEVDFPILARTLAELQSESLTHLDDLRAVGLREITLDWLEKHVRVILKNPRLDGCEEKSLLSFLRGKISTLEEICGELRAVGLPNTLVLGALHEGNVRDLVPGGPSRYMIFDWGSAFIGNPLFDLIAVSQDANNNDSDVGVLTSTFYDYWAGHGRTAVPKCALSYAKSLYWVIDIHFWLRAWDLPEEVDHEQMVHPLRMSLRRLGHDIGYQGV